MKENKKHLPWWAVTLIVLLSAIVIFAAVSLITIRAFVGDSLSLQGTLAMASYGGFELIIADTSMSSGVRDLLDHYRDESLKQLEFEIAPPFDCPNKKIRSFEDCKKRPSFISDTQINDYIEKGFCNFKLVGRGLPQSMVLDSYLYFLIKAENRDKARRRIEDKLKEIAFKKSSQARR